MFILDRKSFNNIIFLWVLHINHDMYFYEVTLLVSTRKSGNRQLGTALNEFGGNNK